MSAERPVLRFLFITADPYPSFRPDVAVLFGKEFAARGHRIDWLTRNAREGGPRHIERGPARWWLADTRTEGGRLRRAYKHWLSLLNDLRAFALCARTRYDFVQVKDKFLGGLVGLAAARRCGRPFVYWLSWPFPEASRYMARSGMARYPLLYRLRGYLQGFVLYRILLPRAAHVFVQSERMKADLAAKGVPCEKMTAVPMGVDLDEVAAVADAARDPDYPQDIVYLGALGRGRRVDFLLRVFARIRPRYPAARLVLVGGADDPADVEALRGQAEALGIADRVVFTGFLPRGEALGRVKQAYVCVSPFYPVPILQSTSPTKLVEYMALGKAVVANDHPEQSLVIAESGAGLCVPYREEAFAGAVAELLDNPQRVARLGERARTYVAKRRDYRVLAAQVEAEYYRLVPGPAARPPVDSAAGAAAPGAGGAESGEISRIEH